MAFTSKEERKMSEYWLYGMRERGFGPGCQPKEGLVGIEQGAMLADGKDYWDIVAYERELSNKEVHEYELDFICKAKKEET